jgi:hypothetical protein
VIAQGSIKQDLHPNNHEHPPVPNNSSLQPSPIPQPRPDSNVLLVTMEGVVRDMPLHSVGDEKKSIQNLTTCVSIHTTTLSSTTSTEVLDPLPNHDIVHFACHEIQTRSTRLSHT